MSQERYLVLARVSEAVDREGFVGILPFATEDFEFHEPPEQPGATVLRGHDQARKGWARWSEAWTEQSSEPEGVRELPDGRIIAFTNERMRGRDGIEVNQRAAHLITFRGDKISRWESYWDRENALEAAGLAE